MSPPRKFLVVDDNPDSRFLLVKTLLRKFPRSILQESHDGDAALSLARSQPFDVAIVHRSAEMDGVALVGLLRQENPRLPIVMVSGMDRSKQAREAGATTFLSYEAWLRIGLVVEEILGTANDATSGSVEPGATTPSPAGGSRV